MLKCSRPVRMELWAAWASGRRGWNDRSFGVPSTQPLVVSWQVPVLPLGKYREKTESLKKKIRTCWDFLSFFTQQSSDRTVRNLHWAVNYSRNSFVRETHGRNWVCHFSFGLLCRFLPLFSLLPVNTHPQKKINKLETTLCLVLQRKSDCKV